MEMASYILTILRSDLLKVFSWGFENPIAIQNGLRFRVSGFIHKGYVEVVYNEGTDLFDIKTLNRDGSIAKSETDVYADSLVNVIDGMVERTPDYPSRVQMEYQVIR